MSQFAPIGPLRGAARLKVVRALRKTEQNERARRIEDQKRLKAKRHKDCQRAAHVDNLVAACLGDKVLARAIIDWLVGQALVFPREVRIDGRRVAVDWLGVPSARERRYAESVIASVCRACAVCVHTTPAGKLQVQMEVVL